MVSKVIPKRIQRRRTRGWMMPTDAVYVGRPTDWGNPYTEGSRKCRVDQFRSLVDYFPEFKDRIRNSLRGKDLACWCPLDEPCHADILIEVANS